MPHKQTILANPSSQRIPSNKFFTTSIEPRQTPPALHSYYQEQFPQIQYRCIPPPSSSSSSSSSSDSPAMYEASTALLPFFDLPFHPLRACLSLISLIQQAFSQYLAETESSDADLSLSHLTLFASLRLFLSSSERERLLIRLLSVRARKMLRTPTFIRNHPNPSIIPPLSVPNQYCISVSNPSEIPITETLLWKVFSEISPYIESGVLSILCIGQSILSVTVPDTQIHQSGNSNHTGDDNPIPTLISCIVSILNELYTLASTSHSSLFVMRDGHLSFNVSNRLALSDPLSSNTNTPEQRTIESLADASLIPDIKKTALRYFGELLGILYIVDKYRRIDQIQFPLSRITLKQITREPLFVSDITYSYPQFSEQFCDSQIQSREAFATHNYNWTIPSSSPVCYPIPPPNPSQVNVSFESRDKFFTSYSQILLGEGAAEAAIVRKGMEYVIPSDLLELILSEDISPLLCPSSK